MQTLYRKMTFLIHLIVTVNNSGLIDSCLKWLQMNLQHAPDRVKSQTELMQRQSLTPVNRQIIIRASCWSQAPLLSAGELSELGGGGADLQEEPHPSPQPPPAALAAAAAALRRHPPHGWVTQKQKTVRHAGVRLKY